MTALIYVQSYADSSMIYANTPFGHMLWVADNDDDGFIYGSLRALHRTKQSNIGWQHNYTEIDMAPSFATKFIHDDGYLNLVGRI